MKKKKLDPLFNETLVNLEEQEDCLKYIGNCIEYAGLLTGSKLREKSKWLIGDLLNKIIRTKFKLLDSNSDYISDNLLAAAKRGEYITR